jgi:hypothetical protein
MSLCYPKGSADNRSRKADIQLDTNGLYVRLRVRGNALLVPGVAEKDGCIRCDD